MKNLKLISTTAVLLVSGVFSFAQQTNESKTISKCENLTATTLLFNGASPVDVPEGAGAWAVQILTTGGILGNGKGDLVLTSAGNFSRNQSLLTESKPFTFETLQPTAQLISKVQISEPVKPFLQQISQSSNASLCSDCYKTTFILSRREADGKVKTFVATWDAVTKTQVAEEVLQIYESVRNLIVAKE